MKKLVSVAVGLFMLFFLAGAGWAAAYDFSFTHDYGLGQDQAAQGEGPYGDDFIILDDHNSPRFADEFDLSGYSFSGPIVLQIEHARNGDPDLGPGCATEMWHYLVYRPDNTYYNEAVFSPACANNIDWLSDSTSREEPWVTDTYLIDPAAVRTAPLRILFAEETLGNDSMLLNSVTVSFNGSQVPLPGAFWLLGSGILGLAGIRRRRR